MDNEGEKLFDVLQVKRLTNGIIEREFAETIKDAKNRMEAAFIVSENLGISERTIWRVVNKEGINEK